MIPLRLYAYAAAILALVLGLAYYRHALIAEGEARVIEADRAAVERQRIVVADAEKLWATRLTNARTEHDVEVANLLRPVPVHHIVCYAPGSSAVPISQGVPAVGNPSSGVVHQDAGLHPDIGPALELLARRADKLAADKRELDSLTQ